jgi:hypothetical protein
MASRVLYLRRHLLAGIKVRAAVKEAVGLFQESHKIVALEHLIHLESCRVAALLGAAVHRRRGEVAARASSAALFEVGASPARGDVGHGQRVGRIRAYGAVRAPGVVNVRA